MEVLLVPGVAGIADCVLVASALASDLISLGTESKIAVLEVDKL